MKFILESDTCDNNYGISHCHRFLTFDELDVDDIISVDGCFVVIHND